MVVRLGLELGLYLGELVFQHGEVDADVMLGPELLLVPDRTVRTAPDEVSQGLRVAHHIHGDDTGGITYFECPINVKANELGQACASCGCAMEQSVVQVFGVDYAFRGIVLQVPWHKAREVTHGTDESRTGSY